MDGGPLEMTFSLESLKEPRGFIKVLQWILAIFAFATTTGHDSATTFEIDCAKINAWFGKHDLNTPQRVTYKYHYSYDLDEVCFDTPICNNTKTGQFCLMAGAESAAQFYVFVGVMVFLYCLAALAVYILYDEFYRRNTRTVIVDFVATIVITLLWLIASCAWAQGVSDVKMYTDPEEGSVFDSLTECGPTRHEHKACSVVSEGNFASLNVSIIFGFLNFGVWIGNLWFLYKDTPWFNDQQQQAAGTPGLGPGEGSANVY